MLVLLFGHLAAVSRAAALALAGVLGFAAVVARLAAALALQEFWPLQACFSFTFLSALALESSCAEALERFLAEIVALVPARRPATAAPASRIRFVFVISP